MEILRLLDSADWISGYEIQEYRRWADGFYRKIKIVFADNSVLFAREYSDESERNYSFHWQSEGGAMISRWDNAPHHKHIATFPHHRHRSNEEIVASETSSLKEILEIIGKTAFGT
jgi:hypothetical protein